MIEEVYDFLRKFGFSKEELKEFENRNEKMYFTNMDEIQKNTEFLIVRGLSKEEIIDTYRINPYMITVKNDRLEELDKIYKETLLLSNDEIKSIILLNPYAYTESPIELQKIIDYLKDNNHSIDSIKSIIINNPKLLDLKLDELKEIINKID